MTRINTLRQTIGGRFTPEELANALGYENFSTKKNYAVGEKVFRSNKFWIFKSNHAKGAWNAQHVEPYNIDADMESIKMKIPAEASNENQLADKEYVNQGISTATATFRGTFNLVSDLELTTSASEEQIAAALASKVATKDNNDYCFVQIPTDSETPTEIRRIDRYKFNGINFAFEFELNNTGFTKSQWKAINSGITSTKVAKLNALPEAAQLYIKSQIDALLAEKLDKDGYSKLARVGLADNLAKEDEFEVLGTDTMTASTVNVSENGGVQYNSIEVATGQAQVVKVSGNGACLNQLYGNTSTGSEEPFSKDADCPNDLVVRYADVAQTVEMGYLACQEVLTRAALEADNCALLSGILTAELSKAEQDRSEWVDPQGLVMTVQLTETEGVTTAAWTIGSVAVTPVEVCRRAVRVKASEANRGSENWWFTTGSRLRQIGDMAVKKGIDGIDQWGNPPYRLPQPYDTCTPTAWLRRIEAEEPAVGIQTQNAGTLEAVKLVKISAPASRNLLDPQTGEARLCWYENTGYVDGQYRLKGMPSDAVLTLTNLATGLAVTLSADTTTFEVGSQSLLTVTSVSNPTLSGCGCEAEYDGEYAVESADVYAVNEIVLDVTKVYAPGQGDGGSDVQVYPEGMRGAGSAADVMDVVNETASVKVNVVELGTLTYSEWGATGSYVTSLTNARRGGRKCLSSKMAKASGESIYKGVNDMTICIADGFVGSGTALRKAGITSAAAFKSAMSGVHLFYELATPIQYSNLVYRNNGVDTPLSELTRSLTVNNYSTQRAHVADAVATTQNGYTSRRATSASPRITYIFAADIATSVETHTEQIADLQARVYALEHPNT